MEAADASRSGYDAPQFEIDGRVTSYCSITVGEREVVSDTVEHLTGHLPWSLRETLSLSIA